MRKPISLESAVAEQKGLRRNLPIDAETAHVAATRVDAVIVGQEGEITTDMLVKEKRRELDDLWVETGDVRFWKAASQLVPYPKKRPERRDDLAIRRMKALIERGFADTPHGAAEIVAKNLPGEHNLTSTITRLRRKYKAFCTKVAT